jgi:hypothetical protein
LNQAHKQKLEQHNKNIEEKVLKLTIHNESLMKETQKFKMKIAKLKKRNNLLYENLAQRELGKVET